MQRPGGQPPAVQEKSEYFKWRSEADSPGTPKRFLAVVEWNGYPLLASRSTLTRDLLS
jgi:hypothetical protein